MTIADNHFIKMCKNILIDGVWTKGKDVRTVWKDGEVAHSIYLTNVVNEYDLQKEAPILTIRPTYLKKGWGETLWIYKDKSNDIQLLNEKYGIYWWDSWRKADGTIGAAYGGQVAKKHRYAEGEFDMMDRLLFDLSMSNKVNRRMIINLYNHEDLHDMALYPCAFQTIWNTRGEYLDMLLIQRSSDVLAANNINVMQYAMFLTAVAHCTGYKPGKLTHIIGNAHIYDRHVEAVQEIIEREPRQAPTLIMPEKTSFYDYEMDDFQLLDYNPHPQVKFEIAI